MVLLIFVVSIDSMNVREVGELRWGRSIGVSAEVWPIYIHFYRDTGGHEYVVTNLLGGGVAMINIDDPSNPYVASVALADTTVFKFPTMVDGAGVVDVEIVGRWMFMGLDDGEIGGLEVWDITDGTAPRRVGTVVFDSTSIAIKGRVHTIYVDSIRERMFVNLRFRPMWILKLDTTSLRLGDVVGSLTIKGMVGVDNGSYHHDIYVIHGSGRDTIYSFTGRGDNDVCAPGDKGITRWIVLDATQSTVLSDGYVTKCSGYGFSHSGAEYQDSLLFNYYETEGGGYAVYKLDKSGGITVADTVVYYRAEGFGAKSSVHEGEIKNGRLYVAYYWGGLRIYDIGDIENPAPVGYYDFYDEIVGEHIFNGASDVKVKDGKIYVVGFMGFGDTLGRDSGYLYVFEFDSSYTLGEEYVRVRACRYPTKPYLRIRGVEHRVDMDSRLIGKVRLPVGAYTVELRQNYASMDTAIATFTLVVDGTVDTFEIGQGCEGLKYSGGEKVRFVGKNTSVVLRDNGKIIYLEAENGRWTNAQYFGEGNYPAIAGDRDVCMDADIVWIKHDTIKYATKPFGDPIAISFDSLPLGGSYSNLRYLNVVRVWDTTDTYLLHLFFVANDGSRDVIVHNTYTPYTVCPITVLPTLLNSEVLWEVNESDGISVDAYSSGSEKLHLIWESGDTLWYANWNGSGWTSPYPFFVSPSGASIKQPTVKVEGGNVYVGWVEEIGMAKIINMKGMGRYRKDTIWQDTINLYTARRISRVHYAGSNYYMFGYEDGFISRTSDILAENMNSRFTINLTGSATVRDEWPYGDASLRYTASGVRFRYVWKRVEGWKEGIEIGEKNYVPPVMSIGGMGKAVFVGSGVYIGDSGGVYVVKIDSGKVKLKLGGVGYGVFREGEVVLVPRWVYRDGKVEVEAVGGKVSLYHFEGVPPSSGPMGMNMEGANTLWTDGKYIFASGEGELEIYDISGRKVKSVKIRGEGKVEVKGLARGVYFVKFKEEVMKFIRR